MGGSDTPLLYTIRLVASTHTFEERACLRHPNKLVESLPIAQVTAVVGEDSASADVASGSFGNRRVGLALFVGCMNMIAAHRRG